MRHVNAGDVLPQEVLGLVQRYCTGYVYVPATGERYRMRDEEILRLKAEGLGTGAIAERVGLCERRIRQILAVEKVRA